MWISFKWIAKFDLGGAILDVSAMIIAAGGHAMWWLASIGIIAT